MFNGLAAARFTATFILHVIEERQQLLLCPYSLTGLHPESTIQPACIDEESRDIAIGFISAASAGNCNLPSGNVRVCILDRYPPVRLYWDAGYVSLCNRHHGYHRFVLLARLPRSSLRGTPNPQCVKSIPL